MILYILFIPCKRRYTILPASWLRDTIEQTESQELKSILEDCKVNLSRPLVLSFATVVCISLIGASVSAQEPSARERQLENLVRKLSDKVDKLESRISELEGSTDQRVEKLEQDVEKIGQAPPPDLNSKEWQRVKQWASNDLSLRSYWKDGLRFDSFDGSVKLKIGGRVQIDAAHFVENSHIERRLGIDFGDNSEFRRSRLYVSGEIYDNIEFKAQYDFAGGDVDFKDVYVGFRNLPNWVGNVRIGHFKEPFSIEELTSSKYVTFMERNLDTIFAPSRNTGVMLHNTFNNQRGTWALGTFRQSDSFGDGKPDRSQDIAARVTYLPVYENGGKKLVHVGAAYAHRNFESDTLRYRARPESHLSPRLIDTGTFKAEYADILQAELAVVDGPFSVQAEATTSIVQSRSRFFDDPVFWGGSIQASYFLTGEHRPYKKSGGVFGGVKPKENYTYDGGKGAWELAARYSHLNLNAHNIHGGRLNDVTLGINWYLNPNLRMAWNYVWADAANRSRDGGEVNIFQWRVQLAF